MEATFPKLFHSKLLYVADKNHKCKYLIDTGAAVSVLPKSCTNRISDADCLPLVAANNTTINTYGNSKRVVDVGLKRQYPWTFIVADVKQPIIGADFLIHYNLLVDAIAPPLTTPHDGPYKVVARSGRVMKILMKGKVETISLDRVKPAHLECEPTTGPKTQRTTPNKKQSSKTTRIASGNPQDPSRPIDANTQMSNRTSVKKKQSTAVRSSTKLATVPQQPDDKVELPNKGKAYVAPHSRAPATAAFCERTHAYLYIYGVKPLVQLTPYSTRIQEIVRILLIATKFRNSEKN